MVSSMSDLKLFLPCSFLFGHSVLSANTLIIFWCYWKQKRKQGLSPEQVFIAKKKINWIYLEFFPLKFFPATVLYLPNENNGHMKYFPNVTNWHVLWKTCHNIIFWVNANLCIFIKPLALVEKKTHSMTMNGLLLWKNKKI